METCSRILEDSFCCYKKNAVEEIFKESVSDAEDCHKLDQTVALPGDVSELTENLILCSATSVNRRMLDALDITCVINVAPELLDTPLHRNDVIYRRIDVMDYGSGRIGQYFDETADLIQEVANSGGRTLVYCVAGVSRSASICLAYLMKHQGLSLLKAYNLVKSRRAKIRPNCGFFKQLIEFECRLYGSNSVEMVFNEFVRMEIPSVYDSEYRFVSYNKGRNGRR